MRSALNIFPAGGLHDYQKSGYFYEQRTGTPLASSAYLFPFFYPFAASGETYTTEYFYLQRIDRVGNVIIAYELDTNLINFVDNGERLLFVYYSNFAILDSLESYDTGIYRFYIELTASGRNTARYTQFRSGIFTINECKLLETIEQGAFDEGFDEGFDT